jgi:5-methylcytosine-specific restriction protein A
VSILRRRAVPADTWGRPERDDRGRPVCRWCRTVVRPPRRTFCGDACVHEWRVRSDPRYVRQQVWKRDRGVCRLCGFDVGHAERRWRREKPAAAARALRRAWRDGRPRWEADHILPVADGGGECSLDNYRLLCRTCHVAITVRWRATRQELNP